MKKLIGFFLILCLVIITVLLSKYTLNKSYDTSTPKNIVKSYFLALNNNDYEFIKTLTGNTNYVDNGKASIIKTVKLFHIEEDKRNAENFIKYGMGKTNTYYDVVSFKVTYYINHKKGQDPLRSDGINTKWITLTQDKENSQWIFREMGEG